MISSSALRLQIESALAHKIPSALTPSPRMVRPVTATGIVALDDVLRGGLPVGALSELTGPEGSGRTSVALSLLAEMTRAAKVCAWIDVSDALNPGSAAAAGVDLTRLLWVRCGIAPHSDREAREQQARHEFTLHPKFLEAPEVKRGLHGGGYGPHPRSEVRGLPEAVSNLLQSPSIASALMPAKPEVSSCITPPRCAEPQLSRRPGQNSGLDPERRPESLHLQPFPQGSLQATPAAGVRAAHPRKPWSRMEQALRATDLLVQAGGFSAIVLDMGSLPAEAVTRVPLATWFRYRAAAERTQSSIVLLTPCTCAKSSAELLLRLEPGQDLGEELTVFTGMEHSAEVVRRRFNEAPSNVVAMRKPPQRAGSAASPDNATSWQSRTVWAGPRFAGSPCADSQHADSRAAGSR